VSRRDKARGAEKRPRISEFDQFDVRFQGEERRVHLQKEVKRQQYWKGKWYLTWRIV
jgi:hypothetical protein